MRTDAARETAGTIRIAARFNGPPASGNGGWVAGLLADVIGAPVVDVSLRAPPPLDKPLGWRAEPSGGVALRDGDVLLATAEPVEGFDLAVPPLPDASQIEAAGVVGRMRAGRRPDSPYVRCFVCGIARDDGLRIVPGRVGDRDLVAASWTPPAELAGADRRLPAPLVWAALDCPAGIAWGVRLGNDVPMMTARITATIDRPLSADQRYAVIGWPIEQQGRKLYAGTAIVDREGVVHARSRQLWLLPRQTIDEEQTG